MIQTRAIDVESIRRDFPIFTRKVNGKPLVYLDSAATSQKPDGVIESMNDYYRRYNANPHRGVYAISEEATAAYESARQKVATFIQAPSPKEIVFTRNVTEAINLVRYSWGRANVRAGDRILLTEMEHHSNLVPWQLLAREVGAQLDFLYIDDDGLLRLEDLDRKLEGARLVVDEPMPHGRRVADGVGREEERARHTQRVEHQVLKRRLVGQARGHRAQGSGGP